MEYFRKIGFNLSYFCMYLNQFYNWISFNRSLSSRHKWLRDKVAYSFQFLLKILNFFFVIYRILLELVVKIVHHICSIYRRIKRIFSVHLLFLSFPSKLVHIFGAGTSFTFSTIIICMHQFFQNDFFIFFQLIIITGLLVFLLLLEFDNNACELFIFLIEFKSILFF